MHPAADQSPPKMFRVQIPTPLKTTTRKVQMSNKTLVVRALNVDPAEKTLRLRRQKQNRNLRTLAQLL